MDRVEHCGPRKVDGDFVHSLVLTDIATGWTECMALPCRNQELVIQAILEVERTLPFPILGIDTDSDSTFMGVGSLRLLSGLGNRPDPLTGLQEK